MTSTESCPTQFKIAILTPGYGQRDQRAHEAVQAMVMYSKDMFASTGVPAVIKEFFRGTCYVQMNRDNLLDDAREWKATHVLWLDSDAVPNEDTLDTLFAASLIGKHPFVSALARMNSVTNPHPQMFQRQIQAPWETADVTYSYVPVLDYAKGRMVEVDAVGFTCVLMTMELANRMRETLNGESPFVLHENPHLALGEDIAFCHNVQKAGFKVCVLTDCTVGHVAHDAPVIDEEFVARYSGRHNCRNPFCDNPDYELLQFLEESLKTIYEKEREHGSCVT